MSDEASDRNMGNGVPEPTPHRPSKPGAGRSKLAAAGRVIRQKPHVLGALLLVLVLPFAMNQLDARETLKQQITDKIEVWQSDPPPNKNIAAGQIKCLSYAHEMIQGHMDGGYEPGEPGIRTIRRETFGECDIETLQKERSPPNTLQDRILRTLWYILASFSPNGWPSLVLVFFIVSVCAIIGYAATTLREPEENEPVRGFQLSHAVFSTILAFGFLLILKSGYGLAFGLPTESENHNVYGLAFIGFMVGLFTEEAFKRLRALLPKDQQNGSDGREPDADPPLKEDQAPTS